MQEASGKAQLKHEDLLRVEKELRETEDRYRMLVEQSPDSIVIHDLDGRILFTNASRVEVLGGKTPEDIIGRNAMEFVHPDDRDFVMGKVAESLENYKDNSFDIKTSIKTIEHRFVRLDGTEFFGEATGVPFIYKGHLAMQVIVRDITERREAEEALNRAKETLEEKVRERTESLSRANQLLKKEIAERKQVEEQKERIQAQLLQAQKMEAVGTLAGGIAHDFNNIMTAIKNMTSLALGKINDTDPLKEYIAPLKEISERAISLVQQLLIFSQKKPFKPRTFNLNKTIGGLMNMIQSLVGEDIGIVNELEDGLLNIEADEGRIEQVIANLVVNGRDAMPLGGDIVIRTKNVIAPDELPPSARKIAPGNFVRLTVEDSGVGMDKETLGHIFEPFFTTKSPKGSGLGLSVVYGIVNELGGWVDVLSKPGAGTRFEVYIPASSKPEGASAELPTRAKPADGGGRRVLLVEDDKWVRTSTAIILSECGYDVTEAANAKEAVGRFAMEEGRFDLVLSDVVMPGGSGLKMLDEIYEISPGVPVLLFSSYLDDRARMDEISKRGLKYMHKPYEIPDLLKAVEEAMGTASVEQPR